MRHKGSGLINMTTAGGISLGQPTVRLLQVNGWWLEEPVADIGGPQSSEGLVPAMRFYKVLDSLEGDSISGKVVTSGAWSRLQIQQ